MESKTIDAIQGDENEAVIISMVRSNGHKKIGFMQDKRRLNVALSRAKKHLTIIADVNTLESNPLMYSLFEYTKRMGMVESIKQEGQTTKSFIRNPLLD